MVVTEKPLTHGESPLHSKCLEGDHYFREVPIPPGSTCECGQKVMILDPCRHCGLVTPMLGDVKNLEEGYYV